MSFNHALPVNVLLRFVPVLKPIIYAYAFQITHPFYLHRTFIIVTPGSSTHREHNQSRGRFPFHGVWGNSVTLVTLQLHYISYATVTLH